MGTIELSLLLKFGVPLAVQLLANGRDEKETTIVVSKAVAGMAASEGAVVNTLLLAEKIQTRSIVDGLYGVITGASDALSGLIKAILNVLGGK